jgi:hypothetical protein
VNRQITILRTFVEIFIAASVGAAVYFLSALIDPDNNLSLILLPFVGFALGIFGRVPILLIGPATMLFVVTWSGIDLALGHSSGHELWPIELMVYGVISLIGLACAAVGRGIKRLWIKKYGVQRPLS